MRALGFDVKKADVLKLMKEYDRYAGSKRCVVATLSLSHPPARACSNETGQIEYADFVDIMTQKMADRDPEEEIRKAFALFDEDQTGTISVKNLRRVARELVRRTPPPRPPARVPCSASLSHVCCLLYSQGEVLSDDELQAMIDEFDKV